MNASDALIALGMRLSLTHRHGDQLFDAGKFQAAKALYLQEVHKIVGAGAIVPGVSDVSCGGVIEQVYIDVDPFKRANLFGCFMGMARCFRRENNLEMALAWCEEVNSLYRSLYHAAPHPMFDWKDYILDMPELTFNYVSGLCLASEIFASLGNSGTAATRRWASITTTVSLPDAHQTPAMDAVRNTALLMKLCESRHPDPQATHALQASVPALQVRGSWKRLHVATLGGVTDGRENFSSFIWNSHMYVAGGRRTGMGPWYRDIWALDLAKLDAWRRLPDYPVSTSGMFLGWTILVHNDTALLFTGRAAVDVLDLKTEKWSSFTTTYVPTAADRAAGVVGSWPYPGHTLADATMQIVGGKLYVFGGAHRTTSMGCNLFMQLDLATRRWRRLSGTVRVTEHGDYSCPGPRKSAASWVSPDKTRLFLLFGSFDRQAATMHDELHGSDESFGYADFWSWSIQDETWRRERMAGNPPCARTEMAFAYNEKLQKAVVFGGYHPSLSTYVLTPGKEIGFDYSYFADTFVYEAASASASEIEPTLSAPKWRQVLTPGFPTYRCQAHLACDPATGKTYMFGGWTNSQFIPTRSKLLSRSFGDLWELRMDVPGGHFEGVDVAAEARVARAGPWQRCFTCAAAGPWKKCGGSCKGLAFFCGPMCLREGWKEHKQIHSCRKA
ncbi:hypothetical protein B0H15DRAFT_924949 [Mycena belliarum]|uniref:Uncharacterized protein n=1 Tax=Mycena belliarum TaxID=1033014 RepID=A0AAD6XNV3_9AGAR|nr:hypothetical protein B0H15DRAFT_924949 [Mycena belliae]